MLINFLNSQLDTRDSRLETRDSILETIEDRVSSLEARGTANLLLSGTVCKKEINFQSRMRTIEMV